MTTFYGGADFKILHHNFISGDMSQKLFMMKDYESESACWGKGAVIHLDKAEPFLLNIILEWSHKNPNGYVGDETALYYLVNKYIAKQTHQKIRKSHANFKKRTKRMLSLHNLIRSHKPILKKEIKKVTA
ncbi:conserved protein of unknown function [Tenacibaculum sp. 190524A02b]|uniref:hypothetical protein n=1 Tax=Tenacibaculum vairaonense TaxID=3137860 RepID=UPI0032B1CADA